jgi:hypothetical protein
MHKILKHSAAVALEGALIAVLVIGVAAGTAFAGKTTSAGGGGKHGGGGTTGGSGTITLAALVTDVNGNGTPNWSDVITFNIATSATTQPWVHLTCAQSGTMVAQGWDGYFEGALGGRNFGLSSPSWSGGAADCTARLETSSGSVLGSTTFHVDA